jgi:radical SAM superfamily enzyme YgiQ (UPF0313 family)
MSGMRSRRKVLLVQLPIPPLGPQPIRGNVPLAAGYLKLYARQLGLEEHFDIEILPAETANRLGDQALVAAIAARDPWMVGFTCYLWNIDRTLWVADQLKRRLPETLVMIGGPEVTPDNDWVLACPSLDYAVVGEGEQTFAEFLAWRVNDGTRGPRTTRDAMPLAPGVLPVIDGRTDAGLIPGLSTRVDGRLVAGPRRHPMPSLDAISSPYLHGILNAGDQEQLLLETIRGCIFKCKFCYYPKAYDGLYYVSREKILANLEHARDNGAKEVYLLDPTLNQRRDFGDFLQLLKQGNPDGRLEYYAELRGEGITAEHARLMREANFKEVEIGLQSIDPTTQDLMERRNNLKAFERGVRFLQAEGIRVKVDLIVGLPGDTVDTIRRGMHYLANGRLYDDMQVFQLSILPGTSFRHEAASLGLEFQPRPPYYVLRTQTLELADMLGLLHESEEIFETEFDPVPEPTVAGFAASDPPGVCRFDMNPGSVHGGAEVPAEVTQAFTLWFRTRDAYRDCDAAARTVRRFLDGNPFSTLQVVLETDRPFPFDVFDRLRKSYAGTHNIYLDRFYEFTPGSRAGARRTVLLASAAARSRFDDDWLADAEEHCDVVWDEQPAAIPAAS